MADALQDVSPRYDPEAVAPFAELMATYAWLRDEHPVYVHDGNGSVALSRFADVHAALGDATRFSSVFLKRTPHPILAQLDPPRHTAMRKVILRAFTPSRVGAMEAGVRTLAGELLDGLLEQGDVDLARDYAAVLPSTVMGRLLGVPEPLIPRCREISDLHMRRVTHADALVPIRMSDELFTPLLDERRGHPTDDLLSALVHAEVDGDRLSDDDLLGFCYTLLIGGNDTTTNWIGNAIGVLLRDASLREVMVGAGPVESFLEEVLRAESPTQVLFRRTTVDVELHGTVIPSETRVLLVVGAANRDPREFEQPDVVTPELATTRHVALGQGIHFCLGAALARLEARVAVEELLARAPGLAAAGDAERIRSSWALGWERLPARLA
ncbi:MAG: cytochrome P450 [Acidimicrobiia bacterium]